MSFKKAAYGQGAFHGLSVESRIKMSWDWRVLLSSGGFRMGANSSLDSMRFNTCLMKKHFPDGQGPVVNQVARKRFQMLRNRNTIFAPVNLETILSKRDEDTTESRPRAFASLMASSVSEN